MAMYFLKKGLGSRLINVKQLMLIWLFFAGINTAMSQPNIDLWKSKLQQATIIEGRCLGYACKESALFTYIIMTKSPAMAEKPQRGEG